MTETVYTRDQYDKAVTDFRRADDIEKTAGDLRAAARKVILDYCTAHPEEFTSTDDEKKTVYGPEGQVSITTPTKKGLPARFDDSRSEEAYLALEDINPEAAALLFRQTTVYTFVGPGEVVTIGKARPELAKVIAEALLPYVLPATEDEPMAPRVAPVKGKKAKVEDA